MDMIAPLLAYAVALSIAAVIPGPGIAALVGQSLGGGLKMSLFFLAGIALGDIVYLTIAVAGLAALAQLFSGAFLVIKILGAAYLLFLAYKFWHSQAGLTQVSGSKNGTGFRAFLTGFSVTLGNPKTIIFYLALLPTVLNLGAVGVAEWLVLSSITVCVTFVVLSPYAVLAARARQMMTTPQALVKLNRIAAGVIGTAGVLILGQAAVSLTRRT